MKKPEDIPQGVWDRANAFVGQWAKGPATIRITVARAIMATTAEEREACAKIADELPRCKLRAVSDNVSADLAFSTGANAQSRAISSAIRSLA